MPDIIKDLNLNKNELKNVVVETAPSLSSAPSSPRKNQIYFNSTNNVLYRYNGTTWVADNKVGQIYFNTTDNNLYRYNGSNWVTYQAPLSTISASTISIDNTPTASSTNLVTSGGVYSAIQDSASDTFIISFLVDPFGDITCDKTDAEIADAVNSNKTCLAKISTYQGQSGLGVFNRLSITEDELISANIVASLNDGYVYSLTWPLHGSAWEIEKLGQDYLPDQTSNSGKFLTTNGTASSWSDLPTASSSTAGVIKVGTNLSISNGVLSATDTTYTFDGTYNASTNKAATVSTVTNAINALDGGTIGTGSTTKTITSLSQTNGNVSATFSDIVFPVTSVNTKTGAVNLTASDVGALPNTTEIPTATSDLTNDSNFVSDASYVHTDNNFTTTLKDKLDGIAAGATVDDHKWNDVTLNKSLLANVGEIYVPYLSSTTATSSSLTSATPTPTAYQIAKYNNNAFLSSTTPAADDSSTKVATTAFVSNAISSLGSVLDFKGTKETASQLPATGNKTGDVWIITTDSSEYVWDGTNWEKFGPTIDLSGYVPTSRTVNGKALSTDISLTAADVGAATPSQIPTVTVSQTLTSGEEVGTITIDGTTTTLYAPEDTDTKVNQTKVTYSSYTYWRAIPFGTYNSSTPTGALSATYTTDREYTVDNLRFWPQNGWIRTHAFNPAPNKAGTTNSYNNMTSDSINNIYFRVNATAYDGGDTVLTLYSNGTDMQVRPGGQYHNKVDLGKNTTRWKNLYVGTNAYIDGTIYNNPSSTTVASGDKILVNDTSEGTISSGITLGSSTTQYLANDGSWQNIPTVPTNCEVTVTHVAGTWAVDTTYATMVAAHNAGGIVYFTYGSSTAIASFHTSNTVTANIMYMDSEGIYQMQITVNSSDEVDCTETNYTFPTIYNGETS